MTKRELKEVIESALEKQSQDFDSKLERQSKDIDVKFKKQSKNFDVKVGKQAKSFEYKLEAVLEYTKQIPAMREDIREMKGIVQQHDQKIGQR